MTQMPPDQPPLAEEGFEGARGSAGLAIAAMVLGICGIIPLLGVPLAILGIILGIISLATRLPGKGMATTGIVVGVVGGLGVNLLLLVGVLLPATGRAGGWGIGRSRVLARQAACMSNLNAIAKAVLVYSNSNGGDFPVLWKAGDPNAPLDTSPADDVWSINSTNSMNNLWLLIRDGMVSTGTLHCPSDRDWARHTQTGYGWTDLHQFSYGLHWPYGMEGSKTNPAALGRPALGEEAAGAAAAASGYSSLDGGFVIMADRNPGGSVGAGRKSSNHPNEGQPILTSSCSVSLYKSTSNSNAGPGGDDIYTNGDGLAGGMPTSSTDTSITPVPSR